MYHTLYILVEGETEYAVIKSFLQPYWEQRFNKCQVINYKGNGNLKAKYAKDVERIMSNPDQAVLVLIDIKNDPFGLQRSTTSNADAYNKIQQSMYAGLGMSTTDQIGIFPVVVEVETWLLADPTIQRDYLRSHFTYPEKEIERWVEHYRKGVSAKKYFDKASAVDVYNDNCPHFVLLADWLAGTIQTPPTSSTAYAIEKRKEETHRLQQEYERLTALIEQCLNQGDTTGAGLLKTDRNYIERQINELWISLPDDESEEA